MDLEQKYHERAVKERKRLMGSWITLFLIVELFLIVYTPVKIAFLFPFCLIAIFSLLYAIDYIWCGVFK